ncbi:hypothetical protein GW7_17106 [Heterocephalus glaber]|uniref:DUF4629 domain-containing protein n=1 Tax=Heterocephalus glaber TaxID=10181 RepID=G5C974_HETGA|nr:hypothetical protein GW7_17106 [Heterocephalus glaber]
MNLLLSTVKEMSPETETYVGWQALSQAGFVSQLAEILESCHSRSAQLLEGSPPTESGGISAGAPVHNSTHSLALDSSWEQPEKENWDEMRSESLEPLDAQEIFVGTRDLTLLSLASPDSPKLLASIGHPTPENPGSEDALLAKCHLSLQDPGTLDKGIESSPVWADVEALVENIQLPQVLQSLDDLDQSNQPTAIKAQDTDGFDENCVQENSAITKGLSPMVRKKKYKASEPITGAPEAKMQLKAPESLSGEEGCILTAAASDRAPVDTGENSYRKSPMTASSRTNQDKGYGKGRAERTKSNNGKKAPERKQSGPKVKVEEMPTIPNRNHKRHQPVTGQEVFKRPRTSLSMHMLESVQVFHPLGKKLYKKAQPSQIAAGNTSLMHPIKPVQPVLSNASQLRLTSKTQPGVPRPAVCKPASRATSPCSSLRRVPVATAVTKQHSSPPQPRHPYLIEDFSCQRIPWREPNVPELVMSTPITEEQRPEQEAMKRQAQLEQELAAKYASLGKLQFFRQRERDMEIAQYYGYIR